VPVALRLLVLPMLLLLLLWPERPLVNQLLLICLSMRVPVALLLLLAHFIT
jgi:hypothetical protein